MALVGGEYSCWDESEQATMTFINNPNKTLDHLPTIRLIQGYYPSQYAMQYAAYIYLKEKLGVNVCNRMPFISDHSFVTNVPFLY